MAEQGQRTRVQPGAGGAVPGQRERGVPLLAVRGTVPQVADGRVPLLARVGSVRREDGAQQRRQLGRGEAAEGQLGLHVALLAEGAVSLDSRRGGEWAQRGSNPRPPPCKGGALPLSYTPSKARTDYASGAGPGNLAPGPEMSRTAGVSGHQRFDKFNIRAGVQRLSPVRRKVLEISPNWSRPEPTTGSGARPDRALRASHCAPPSAPGPACRRRTTTAAGSRAPR